MKKILVIDDEPALVDMIKMRLEASNYQVVTASDGAEGLEALRREEPALVLLDILMPRMSGYDFLRALRKEKGKLRDTPVIIVTARGRMKDLFEEIGVDDFISKPFEGRELLEKVQHVLDESERRKTIG